MTNLYTVYKKLTLSIMIYASQKDKTTSHTLVYGVCAQSCLTLYDPMDCSPYQAPLSVGFSRQEYWSELPFFSPFISKVIILKNKTENNKPW